MNFENIDYEKLSLLVQERLQEKGKTISALSEELGWSRQMTLMVIRGSRRIPSSRLEQFLSYLEFSSDEIPRLSEPKTKSKGNQIFISYSHKDKEYLDRLMVHLKPLQKQGLIDAWVDTRLLAGDKWKKEIEGALKKAKVAILLVSADFLASDFIVDNELPPLLQAAESEGTLIIPAVLKPCRFTREKTLREFQAINPPDEPISLMDENERELVYDTIAQRVEDIFDSKSKS
jgi:hypothetical protein